jgi:hypothetical protein
MVEEMHLLASLAMLPCAKNGRSRIHVAPRQIIHLRDADTDLNRTQLSNSEKVAYSTAVNCLLNTPSKSGSFCPGCKSRYDDFVAVHINQTLTIHGTANFLSWHRYFVWAYESALRNECGYQGWQPGRATPPPPLPPLS